MKLFIINKKYFEEYFKRPNYRDGYYNTSNEIHKIAYNKLKSCLAENCIPRVLLAEYKGDNGFSDGDAIFDFKSMKDDIFYYEFSTTVS